MSNDITSFKERMKKAETASETTLKNMGIIESESKRVSEVAHNSKKTFDELENEFEKQTGLNSEDMLFLFLATGLQCSRIYLINKITKIEKAGESKKEDWLKEQQDKILEKEKQNIKETISTIDKPYYASMEHILSSHKVPYDATAFLGDNTKIFNGANHRFATLGHDPVLGLIFGTANIMTNTITTVSKKTKIPLITTNHVLYSPDYKFPVIGNLGSTALMLEKCVERTSEEQKVLSACLVKQVIHIATDLFTPCGIQLPGGNLLLSNTEIEKITKYASFGDEIKISAAASFSVFINYLISLLHTLFYDEEKYSNRNIYSVKTRKIIMYSNTIASASNVIATGIKMGMGEKYAYKEFDIGGLIVTINRLIKDPQLIRKIKEEFILGEFNKKIQGEELNLLASPWED